MVGDEDSGQILLRGRGALVISPDVSPAAERTPTRSKGLSWVWERGRRRELLSWKLYLHMLNWNRSGSGSLPAGSQQVVFLTLTTSFYIVA